jgi:hypothetical protein
MSTHHRLPLALFLMAAVAAASLARAKDDEDKKDRETFTATVVQAANMRLPGGGTFQITMNIDHWTSLEVRKELLATFKEGGEKALIKALRKMKAGYIVPPPFARQPSWEVAVASSLPQPDGSRVIRLFTERPILFGEAYAQTRSQDYQFGIVELKLDAKGEGEGITIPAARLSMEEDGTLKIETLPYSTGPQRLLGVREWQDKKKDKDKDK